MDALRLAFEGDVHHERLVELSSLKNQAPQRGAWLELLDYVFEVCGTGGGGMEFRLRNTDMALLVGRGQFGIGVIAEPRAMFLATAGALEACIIAEQLAGEFLGWPIPAIRLRRLDLCADVMGVSFSADDMERFVGRARKVSHYAVHGIRNAGGVVCTGFSMGKGGILSARLYDKTEELRSQHQSDSHKVLTEHRAWRNAGWDGVSPVWRLEIQLTGKALDQFGVRDPWEALRRLDSMWRYAFGSPEGHKAWIRMVDPTSATRRERRKTDPRWLAFQTADFFSGSKAPSERVDGNHGGVPLEQAIGSVLSCLGSRRCLPTDAVESPAEQLSADLAQLAELVRGTELEGVYVERRDAVRARFADLRSGVPRTPADNHDRDAHREKGVIE